MPRTADLGRARAMNAELRTPEVEVTDQGPQNMFVPSSMIKFRPLASEFAPLNTRLLA